MESVPLPGDAPALPRRTALGSAVGAPLGRAASAALYPVLGALGAAAIVELVSRANILPNRFFPPATEVARSFATHVVTSGFWSSVGSTLEGWALGLGLAVALAVPIGLVMGTSELVYRATRPIVEFLWPIPSVALIPLALLLFGRTLETKLFLVSLTCFWPILLHTIYGTRSTEPLALATARSFRIPAYVRFYRVILPSAFPSIATGIRLASAAALILSIIAELLVGVPGLGREILYAQESGVPKAVYAYIFATGLLGWALMIGFSRFERWVLRSHGEFASKRL
jgi:ABC-type nitrate/sulfonate/bicarbonate transport system permease component